MVTARATIRDVAKAASVSVTTVSMILRGQPGYKYKPETEERVREVARRLGYRPHAAARLLRQQDQLLVGLAIGPRAMSPEVINFVKNVHNEVIARGYQPVFVNAEHLAGDSKYSPFPSPELLAGLISMDLAMEEQTPSVYRDLSKLLPVLALYPVRDPNMDFITTDRELAIRMAGEHLASLGHRRVVYFGLRGGHVTSEPKLAGWLASQRKFGFDANPACTIEITDQVARDRDKFIYECISAINPAPTAAICSSDDLALSLMRVMHEHDRQLPEELSIIGFGGLALTEYAWPSLTTIHQPAKELAKLAVDRMIKHISAIAEGKTIARCRQMVPPALRLGKSTAPVR